ncbi:MAG: c-type cytochrome [Gammaproteobacteria bacterium]
MTRKCVLASAACAVLAFVAGCERMGSSLGRQIYVDGAGPAGRIAYTQGPDWLRFAGVGCVACHGERGHGMTVQASGVTGVAPAVNWAALAERGYDAATLRRALTEGVDPHGREFQYYMPRWALSEDEFAALVAYLKTL